MNLKLRYAIDKARQASMPKDNIERAIKKGTGEAEGVHFEEITYEGYGPGGVAMLVDVTTDNRNRTAGEVRKIFERAGGKMGAQGSVGWMFERKGLFTVGRQQADEDRLFEVALDAGADDVKDTGEFFEVTCPADLYQHVADALQQSGIAVQNSEIARIPGSTVAVDGDDAREPDHLLTGSTTDRHR